MSKRYGYRPREIETKHGRIQVDSAGRAYLQRGDGNRRLNAVWFGRKGVLSVEMLTGEIVNLKPSGQGLEVLEEPGPEEAVS